MSFINRQGASSRCRITSALLGILFMVAWVFSTQAANFQSSVQMPAGQNWNVNANWQPGNPFGVTAGNTYELIPGGNPTRLRPPTTNSPTGSAGTPVNFDGDSLTINAGTELRVKRAGSAGATINFPGVGGNPGLILNGGNITPGDSTAPDAFHIGGIILVKSASTFDNEGDNTRLLVLDAEIRGSGMLTVTHWTVGANQFKVTHDNSLYSGTWNIGQANGTAGDAGPYVHFTGVNSVGTGDILISPGGTFEVDYDLNTAASLTINQTISGGGANKVAGHVVLHQNLTFGSAFLNNTPVPPGVYPYAALLAAYPQIFPAGGSGSITISGAPHPLLPNTVLNTFINLGPNAVGYQETKSADDEGENYVLTGGGGDTWDRGDAMAFVYHEIAGDFDIKVQVAGHSKQINNGCCPKACIMVRNSLAEDSKGVWINSGAETANLNNNLGEFLWRTGVKDVAGHDGGQYSVGNIGTQYPDNWLRLQRVGTVVNGFAGYDGVTWLGGQTIDTASFANGALNNRVFVGLSVSKHDDNNVGETTRAIFQHYNEAAAPTYYVGGGDSLGQPGVIRLFFSHPVNFATINPDGSDFAPGVNGFFIGAVQQGPAANMIDLIISPILGLLTEGTIYSVTVGPGVLDTSGNSVDLARNTVSFVHGAGYPARKIHVYHNSDGDQMVGDSFSYYDGGPNIGYVDSTRKTSAAVEQFFGAEIDGFVPEEDGQLDGGTSQFVFESEAGSGNDNFGDHIVGVLQPAADGDYIFAEATDDTSNLYLSSDDQPANKQLVASQPQWAGSRNYNDTASATSTAQHLLGGTKHFLEITHINGGGGYNNAVTWNGPIPADGSVLAAGHAIANGQLPLTSDLFIPSRLYLGQVFYILGPATVTRDPANVSQPANIDAVFSVVVDGTPPYTYEWKTNGVVVLAPSSPTLTIPQIQHYQNNMHVSVCVSNIGGGSCSGDALLTVLPLTMLNVASRGNCHTVYVTWSEDVKLVGTYTLDNGITVGTPAYGASHREVVLPVTPDLVPFSVTYTVTATGEKALDGSASAPDPSTGTFVHGSEFPLASVQQSQPSNLTLDQFQTNTITYMRWNGFNTTTNDGNGHGVPSFDGTSRAPDIESNMVAFESPWVDDADNYGDTWSGFWVVPKTGPYRFWCASDDQSQTYIATDGNPADMVRLCQEPSWVNYRQYLEPSGNGGDARGNPPLNRSDEVDLTAGQVVYLRGDHIEGGGGDHYALAYAYGHTSPNGTLFTVPCDVFCNPGPTDQTQFLTRTATFTANPDGTPPYTMQWLKNGVAIPGATSASYTTPPLSIANNGDVYTFTVKNFFSSNGCTATLTVPNSPIILSVASRGDPNHVYVEYNKPVVLGDPATEYNITGPGGGFVLVLGSAYGSSHSEVVLDVSATPLASAASYVLTVDPSVTSEDGNTLAPPYIWPFLNVAPLFCTDFQDGVLPGVVSGTTPPYLDPGGELHMTDGVNGQVNYWTVPWNQPVLALDVKWRQYLGTGSSGVGNSADGLSFNMGNNLTFPVAPEEGANDQLSVTVDTYNNGGNETGIEVRWNGVALILVPIGGNPPGSANGPPELINNKYVDAEVIVDSTGLATFNYGSYVASATIPAYTGINANQFVMAGRTGGANESNLVMNLCISGLNSTPGPIAVTVSPAAPAVAAGTQVTFTANVTGSIPWFYQQWTRNGVPIPGATGPTYTTPPLTCADDLAVYSQSVSNLFSSNTAVPGGTIHIIQATTAPLLASASSVGGRFIHAVFNATVDPTTALDASKYSVPGATVVPGSLYLEPDAVTVVMGVTPDLVGAFSVTANGVLDACPKSFSASSTVSSVVVPVCRGFVVASNYDGGNFATYGNTIALLTNNPAYPSSPTDWGYYVDANRPERNAANNHNDDGCRMQGYLVPSETGNFTLGTLSDDASQFFLNTNELKSEDFLYATTLVVNQLGCCAVLAGSTVHLTAGKRYAFIALQENGTGGDYLQLQWSTPSSGMALITAPNVAVYADPGTSTLTITTQTTPLTQTVAVNSPAGFTIAAATGGGYGGPVFYQWQRNTGAGWVDIAGANGTSFSIPLAQLSDAGQYACFVSIPGVCESTIPATLTVVPDTTPGAPAVITGVGSIDGTSIGVCFNEPINDPSASTVANYSINGGAAGNNISQVVMQANHASVVLFLVAPISGAFTVHALGVMDNEGLPSDSIGSGTVQGLVDENIGTPNDPAGSAFSCGLNNITITVGGDDLWGNVDHCHFDYATRTGDFDLRVKIADMTYANSGWSKAGLLAQVDPIANNVPAVATYASHNNNPPDGQIESPFRSVVDGNFGGTGGGEITIGARPPATPNPYLRMERIGDEIVVSHSPDGVTYTVHGDSGTSLCGILPATMYVGVFATANNGNSGVNLIATLENFSLSDQGVVLSSGGLSISPAAAGQVTISWPPCTTLQVSDTLGPTAVWTTVAGASPLAVTIDRTRNQFYRTVR